MGWERAGGRHRASGNAVRALPCSICADLLKGVSCPGSSPCHGLSDFQVEVVMCRYCCFLLLNIILLMNGLINKGIGQSHTSASCLPGTDKSCWWILSSAVPRKLSFCSGGACGARFLLLQCEGWKGSERPSWALSENWVYAERFCNQQNACQLKSGLCLLCWGVLS